MKEVNDRVRFELENLLIAIRKDSSVSFMSNNCAPRILNGSNSTHGGSAVYVDSVANRR